MLSIRIRYTKYFLLEITFLGARIARQVFWMEPVAGPAREVGSPVVVAQIQVPTGRASTAVVNAQGKSESGGDDWKARVVFEIAAAVGR